MENLNLTSMIDHTLLKPDATSKQVEALCKEALEYKFASVCVNPGFVQLCKSILNGSEVKVCTVIGFPLGATTTETKAFEARQAVLSGADEIDMVINIGALKDGCLEFAENDIRAVVEASQGRTVKVIIETCLLSDEEKLSACSLAKNAGAHFVKTSTGFSSGGATVSDIELMRNIVGNALGVKASGGVKDKITALAMVKAGANRIGTSAGIAIATDGISTKNSY